MYLETRTVLKSLIFLLFVSSPVYSQTGKSHKYQFKGDLQETSILPGRNSIVINYSLSELDIYSITNENGSFYRISIPGHNLSTDPGKPELPVFQRLITAPEGSMPRIRISNVRSTRIRPSEKEIKGILMPAQYGESKKANTGERREFIMDKKAYASAGTLQSDTVRIEHLGKIRERKLSNLIISPVKYNPAKNSIEIITSMRIEVSFSGESSGISKVSDYESVAFNQVLEKGVLNYYPDNYITGYSTKPVGMIIVSDTAFRKHLKPLVLWKTQKGFRVTVIYTGDAGNSAEEIKSSIALAYNSLRASGNSPEYLLIIGDVEKVPAFGSVNISDMYYGEFDGGGDYIPDLFIGRIPAADTTEVKSVINKIIQYEKFGFAESNKFYSKALALAGKDENYASYMNGQIKYAVTNYLKPENRIEPYPFYYPEGHTRKDSLIALINRGLSFINYTGHGVKSGWLHLEFKSDDIRKLKNEGMYPFVISNACRTAQFNDSTSLGNKFVLATNKGAIGFIGCSNDSYWDEDFNWAVGAGMPGSDPKYNETGLGAYDRLFHTHGEAPSEWYTTMGQVNFAGNLAVSSTSSLRKKYYWETYSLIGDPSLTPYIGTPGRFNISIPDTLPVGIRSLAITGEPFSYMAISRRGQLLDASFLSPSGSAVLDFQGIHNDSCLVVLTGQNKIPLIKTIYFSSIAGEFLNLSKISLIDSLGNNNQKADYGETVFPNFTISNLGESDATNLTARITSSSPWVTIVKGNAVIGTLRGKSEIELRDKLEIKLAEEVPDQGIITLDLILRDDRGEKRFKTDITIHAPVLEIVNCLIDDSEEGNNNSVADPGETFNLVFQVRNYGSSDVSGYFGIRNFNSALTVPDSNIKSGVLQFGKNSLITVRVKLSETAMFGDYISLLSTLDCTPYIVNRDFTLRVGRVRESFESSGFDVFPWINFDPVPWQVTRTDSYDGNMSARSGRIGHNGATILRIRTLYPEDDSLAFYYKVSSELNYDYLQFKLNGSEMLKASGETAWLRKAVKVPAGINDMEWIYKKDNSVSQGADCAWVDLIDFSGTSPLKYVKRDLDLARIISPYQKDLLGLEMVSVRLLNQGRDTLSGVSLAYQVNKEAPVHQFFPVILYPNQDSVTVTFDTRADLDRNGLYEIVVYAYGDGDDYLLNDTLRISIINNELEEDVVVYPNPFGERLYVSVSSNMTGRITISLTDLAGKNVMTSFHEISAGENLIELPIPKLGTSMYFLSVRGKRIYKVIPVIRMEQ
ncbi:MAG TPA: C25 family cysteine peptidase [Bacteroidales bacterium]|nr:C25 family cysteine peptidase [Bacteroidales bacterium]